MADEPTHSNVSRTANGFMMTPDPSEATIAAMDRREATMAALLRAEVQAQTTALRARLDSLDETIRTARSDLVRVPTDVDRSVSGLRDLTGEKFHTVATRLDGMDEAVKLLRVSLDRRPVEFDTRMDHLKEVFGERFATVGEQFRGVETQFAERDVRGREAALANTTAVNAALQAQKEAAGEQAKSFTISINKSEQGTSEQIKAIDSKIEDVRERLTRMEGLGVGRQAQTVDYRAAGAFAISVVLVTIAVLGFALSLGLR